MLEKLEIKETRDTPEVLFDPENNIFKISGNSLPEDTTEFFTPLFNWLTDYKKSPNDITNLVCELEYFNSSSAKMLYEIFFELQNISKNGKQVRIEWIYEQDDKLIEEKGLEYQSVLEIPFEMIEK